MLATGHVSAQEGLLILREARRLGVRRMVVTHAMNPPISMTVAQMQEAAKEGAFIEFVGSALKTADDQARMDRFADAIKRIGAAVTILSSDLGQRGTRFRRRVRRVPRRDARSRHQRGRHRDDDEAESSDVVGLAVESRSRSAGQRWLGRRRLGEREIRRIFPPRASAAMPNPYARGSRPAAGLPSTFHSLRREARARRPAAACARRQS